MGTRKRVTHVEQWVELPTTCVRCGGRLPTPVRNGRPRVYCSAACRKAAYEDRRAKRDGAVQVKVVDRVVTKVRERSTPRHSKEDCVCEVISHDDSLLKVIRTLVEIVGDPTEEAFRVDRDRIWDLCSSVELLGETLRRRIDYEHTAQRIRVSTPMTRVQRNMQLFTLCPPNPSEA